MTDQHALDVEIAEALEKIQPLNPDLYGMWYSKLYPPYGKKTHWNHTTLTTLTNIISKHRESPI